MEQTNIATKRKKILKTYGYTERFCSEEERFKITGISRTQVFEMEKTGDFPHRISLSKRRIAWFLSDILIWMNNRAALGGGSYDQ